MDENKSAKEHIELASRICGQCDNNLVCPLAYVNVERCLNNNSRKE